MSLPSPSLSEQSEDSPSENLLREVPVLHVYEIVIGRLEQLLHWAIGFMSNFGATSKDLELCVFQAWKRVQTTIREAHDR